MERILITKFGKIPADTEIHTEYGDFKGADFSNAVFGNGGLYEVTITGIASGNEPDTLPYSFAGTLISGMKYSLKSKTSRLNDRRFAPGLRRRPGLP